MTETFPLPSTYTYGKVVARVIYAIGDTAEDVDDKPQARAAAGTVTFTPQATGAKVTSADYTAIVMNGSVRASLSSTGRILDGEGRQGIWLITGIYRVSFTFTATSDGLRGSLPDFLVEVTSSHTDVAPLDLATAVPASVPEGAVVQTVILPSGSGIVSRNAITGAIEYIDPEGLVGGVSSWDDLEDKPAVIAAGTTQAEARDSIGAGTSNLTIGTTAGTAAAGNDSRLSDARTPLAHSHSAADVSSGTLAIGRIPIGTTSSTVAAGNDSRIVGAAQQSANLSDLPNKAAARSNLDVMPTRVFDRDPDSGELAALPNPCLVVVTS